jgi:Family of unknown function (DUF6444)
VESAAGQVSPTGESVAELLARIGRQAALIREYRDREVAKDAVIESLQERAVAQDAKIEALDLLVADLIAQTGRDSQNSSKPPSSDGPGTRADRRRAERERRKSESARRCCATPSGSWARSAPPRWSTACSAPRCRPGGSTR